MPKNKKNVTANNTTNKTENAIKCVVVGDGTVGSWFYFLDFFIIFIYLFIVS